MQAMHFQSSCKLVQWWQTGKQASTSTHPAISWFYSPASWFNGSDHPASWFNGGRQVSKQAPPIILQ
jgi:hypothetical protein